MLTTHNKTTKTKVKSNSMLDDINTKFDSIKSKLESILNGNSSNSNN